MPTRRALFTHWLPPLLWMSLIFSGSTGTLSGKDTSRFILPFLHWLLGNHFTLEKAEEIHFLIRKAGHVAEYTVLGLLLWRALGSLPTFAGLLHSKWRFVAAVGICALYAASDEVHQSFYPSRTASPLDVLLDTFGASLGLLASLGLVRLVRHSRPTSSPPDRF